MKTKKQELKEKSLLLISIALLLIAIGLKANISFAKENSFALEYEYINVKDMAQVKKTTKNTNKNILSDIATSLKHSNSIFSTGNTTEDISKGELEETSLPPKTPVSIPEPKQVWRLPTEIGRVTQSPHYGHAAIDISSPRGTSEYIFPVANGVISSIYKDGAGALIVTVAHNIDGENYTSLYAHLSSYAEGLYVGKEVTVNDVLGRMGSTGRSTGVHLHLVVINCALYNPGDSNCRDLNGFFRYTNTHG